MTKSDNENSELVGKFVDLEIVSQSTLSVFDTLKTKSYSI